MITAPSARHEEATLSAEALAMFPPLPFVVKKPDGATYRYDVIDQRAFLFDARRAMGDRPLAGEVLEGFAQVVCRGGSGVDFVIEPCIEVARAERIASGFNKVAENGSLATVHPLTLPCFASGGVS